MLRLARSLVFFFIFALTGLLNCATAHPVTRYQWFTNLEYSPYPSYAGPLYWSPDTFFGDFRSNDRVLLKLSPHFYGRFITSEPIFDSWHGNNPYFEYEPIFNAPLYPYPESFPHLQENATVTAPDEWNRCYTIKIHLEGEDGVDLYISRAGLPANDSLWLHIDPPIDDIFYLDAEVEVEGVLAGRLTIYSPTNIWLMDNVRYSTSDPIYGNFDPENTTDMLALVAGEDVLVANTIANGREYNFDEDRENHDRHSIIINASVIALHGSLTFDQQNNDWDAYQGSTPDWRGDIYSVGSIAQNIRKYTSRTNHEHTGYSRIIRYDSRLLTDGPPGFAPGEYPYWEGQVPSQHLGWLDEYTFENATLDSLTIDPGVTVLLKDGEALTIGNHFEVNGTAENPVVFRTQAINGRATVRVHADAADAMIRHARFEGNVELICNAENTIVDSCWFEARTILESSSMILSHNTFEGQVSVSCHDDLTVSRNLILGGLSIPVSEGAGLLMNNTIVGSNRTGLFIQHAENLAITNNIIAFNRSGIDSRSDGGVSIRYSNVFGNSVDDYFGCNTGEGCLSLDPLFVDAMSGDYHLAAGSPCIDAGDPDSPNDPDGSRADMGAYPFDHAQDVAEDSITPSAFALSSAYPNPFNSTTTIGYSLPVAGNVSLAVYDVNGRLVETLMDGVMQAGRHSVAWDATGQSVGIYFVKMTDNINSQRENIQKVILLK